MAFRILDGVHQIATGTGTGALTLGSATSALFNEMDAAGILDGEDTRVRIQHSTIAAQWEISLVEYNSGVIERFVDPLFRSATGSLINFSAGDKIVSSVTVGGDLIPRRLYGARTVTIISHVVTINTLLIGLASIQVNSNITSFVFSNLIAGTSWEVQFRGDGNTYTQDWTGITWLTGTPVLSTDNNKRDLAVFWYDGTDVFAAMVAQYF